MLDGDFEGKHQMNNYGHEKRKNSKQKKLKDCNRTVQRDKTMADKLMYITNNDSQNNPFFNLLLWVKMFGHST